MRSSIITGAAAVLTATQLVSAQTFTSCNPTTNPSCPPDRALGKSITVDFTKGSNDFFTQAQGTSLTYDPTNGANFVMSQEGQAPTITSTDYIFFGKVSVVMKAAAGTGIVSSFILESDDLDEIDWEWLGGNTGQVESNYFGKGNTSTYDRAIYHPVANPQTEYHTYSIDWSNESIIWSIDGTDVRTLHYADAVGGKNFPQSPMVIKMGNWDGGASTENQGTIEWAGGLTDWSKAPFTMYVKSVTIEDAQTGATSYTYGDQSGSSESIKISKDGTSSGSLSSTSSRAPASASAASGTSVSPASSTDPSTLSGSNSTGSNSTGSNSTGSNSTGSNSTGSNSTGSNSTGSNLTSSPPFQDPAPLSNTTSSSSSNTTSGSTSGSASGSNETALTPPTDSGSNPKSPSSSASSATSSAALSNTSAAGSKYRAIDVSVLVLALSVGYFMM